MGEKEDEAKKKTELKRKCQKEGQKENKITQDIETIRMRIKVAHEFLKSGQAQLEELTHTSILDKVKLITANAQILTGTKQKSELEKELQHFISQLQKLDQFF